MNKAKMLLLFSILLVALAGCTQKKDKDMLTLVDVIDVIKAEGLELSEVKANNPLMFNDVKPTVFEARHTNSASTISVYIYDSE